MKYTINLTETEVNLVLAGLSELPAKHSIDLILDIKSTCEAQIEPKQETEVETLETE
jgi:hypothetical protein